jgi:hypothetical protein
MKSILTFLLLIITSYKSNSQEIVQKLSDFEIFITKNYRVTQTHRTECKFEYANVVLKIDENNKVVNYHLINEASEEMKNSFNFIKGYQFPRSEKINQQPLLFFLAIDQQEICSNLYGFNQTPASALEKTLLDIKKQLESNSKTIIMYNMITIKVFKTSY